jgi:hypothetical protein
MEVLPEPLLPIKSTFFFIAETNEKKHLKSKISESVILRKQVLGILGAFEVFLFFEGDD